MQARFHYFKTPAQRLIRRSGDSAERRTLGTDKSSGFLPKAATFVWWCLAGCLAGLAVHASAQPEVYGNPDSSAFIRIPSDADDWTRHFRIGALVGMNISAHFSMNGSAFPLSGNDPGRGIFDDGYVRADNTGNAFGQTGYWGYRNASQYDPAAHTLTMHAASSFAASGSATESGSAFAGFDMAYGDNLWYWKHARVGWELGFGLLPISITDNHPASASASQSTYTFSTASAFNPGGIVVPTAPYQGGFDRDGEPTISSTYNLPVTTTNYSGSVAGSHTLDVTLYTLRLGPSFYWDLTDHVGMSLGAGPAIGIVSGSYKYDEIITAGRVSARNRGQMSATDLVLGGYVNAAVMYHVVDNGDIYLSAQYMPMSDATISGGGREGRLDLGGQIYFSVGVSWPF
ncbi:MAG: hypothetical protein ABSA45_10710 [Verrucomicrobiota bacterium]|jgi:hypothetical protein